MEAIELACGSGNMELVQWLIGVVGCGAVIEVACDEEAWYSSKPIASACKRGQLEVARWLVAEYGLRRLCHDPPLVSSFGPAVCASPLCAATSFCFHLLFLPSPAPCPGVFADPTRLRVGRLGHNRVADGAGAGHGGYDVVHICTS